MRVPAGWQGGRPPRPRVTATVGSKPPGGVGLDAKVGLSSNFTLDATVNPDFGEVEVDLVRQTAKRGQRPLHLTAREFAMLRLMAETPGEPISRERFLDVVWGYTAFPTTRTVDNHIASLRSAIETCIAEGQVTPDLGGALTTSEMTEHVITLLR